MAQAHKIDAPHPQAAGHHADLSWTVTYNPDTSILFASLYGIATMEDLRRFAEFSRVHADYHNPRGTLADYSSADFKLSLPEVYRLPEEVASLGAPKEYPVAVVVRKSQRYNSGFAQTVLNNRGYLHKTFVDAAPAMQWLIEHSDAHEMCRRSD